MNKTEKALKMIHGMMYENDMFSQWLGIKIVEAGPGCCTLKADIRHDMLNGFMICHGGITYSIADSALAFASNSHGFHAVSVETSISHTKVVRDGDTVTAVAIEKNLSNKFGVYEVTLTNQNGELIALFKGTVYISGKEWALQ